MNASNPSHSPLRGNLAVTSVPDVLERLESQRCDGRVHFDTEVGPVDVEFAAGTIVRAKFGEHEGKAALFRLLGIVDGSFEITYTNVTPGPALVSNVAELVEARSERFAEWRRLSERAPPPSAVVVPTERGKEALARGLLTDDERRLLELADGTRTITEIIGQSPLDAVEVLRQLMNALDRGTLTVPSSAGETKTASPSLTPPRPRPRENESSLSLRKKTVIGLGLSEPPRGTTEVRRIISVGAPSTASSSAPSSSSSSPPQSIPPSLDAAHRPQESGEIPSWRAQGPAPGAPPRTRGRYVGRYELLCPIGRGGMGSVYLGRLTSEGGFRRLFALKLLRRHLLEDSAAAQRFLEEARLAGHIHHPNVVSVTDAGLHGSQPYLVMDYVEGASFKQLLSSHPHVRPPELILPIILEALAGLHAAHTLVDDDGAPIGIVHCDVSPENLLVGVDGVCRLADFGVAKSAAYARERESVTRGKPGYLAPEQVLGAPVDRRADIFAMGVVLYNALTGIRLFEAPTAEETMQQVCIRRIEPPSTVGLRPPPALDFVCMRALDRDPGRRYSSAEEMMNELRRVALREGLLGSATDIAAWVRESAGRELAHRRLLVLEASRTPSATERPVDPGPGGIGLVQQANALARVPRESALVVPEAAGKAPSAPTATIPSAMTIRRAALIVASTLAAIAVLVTLLWPDLVSRLFRLETERVVAPGLTAPGAAPSPVAPSANVPASSPNQP